MIVKMSNTSENYVRTYIKVNDEFLCFETFEREFPDPEYLDGAIDLVINGVQIHGFDTWDFIDGMWSALISGMREVIRSGSYLEGFPDSAIELVMQPVGSHKVRIAIEKLETRDASVVADRNTTFRMLCDEGRSFLRQMDQRLPQHRESTAPLKEYLEEIEAAIRTTH